MAMAGGVRGGSWSKEMPRRRQIFKHSCSYKMQVAPSGYGNMRRRFVSSLPAVIRGMNMNLSGTAAVDMLVGARSAEANDH